MSGATYNKIANKVVPSVSKLLQYTSDTACNKSLIVIYDCINFQIKIQLFSNVK